MKVCAPVVQDSKRIGKESTEKFGQIIIFLKNIGLLIVFYTKNVFYLDIQAYIARLLEMLTRRDARAIMKNYG